MTDARESAALLPCPFCGSKDIRHDHPSRAPRVYCSECRVVRDSPAAWNTRAATDLEAVREACAKVADAEADDIEQNAHLRTDAWQRGRAAMARTIAAAIRNTDFTKGEA